VGRILARRLGRCFVETDEMITAAEGCPIPEIFVEKGEAHFRQLEQDVLRLLALKRGDVIATGGGLPCAEGRLAALRSIGTVVWLAGDFDSLYDRALRAGDRPMLRGKSREQVAALYESRKPYYAQADLTVNTDGLTTDQVAAHVARALVARPPQAV
jgi:shikimate kinase